MSGLEVPFDDDGLSVTSTENGDISSSYRPENLPYGKDMLVNMNLNGKVSTWVKISNSHHQHTVIINIGWTKDMLLTDIHFHF